MAIRSYLSTTMAVSPPEAAHPGTGSGNPQGAGESEAEVLVLAVSGKASNRWLQDVRRGRRTLWNAPVVVVQEQRRLGLRPGQAELPLVTVEPPRAVVAPQGAQASRDLGGRQPGDFPTRRGLQVVDPLRPNQLHRSRAILPRAAEQGEATAR